MRNQQFGTLAGILVALTMALTLMFTISLPAAAAGFVDVLDVPARQSALAAKGMLNGLALANAGKRVIAVGERGHIVYSDDAGKNWQQAKVPVSSDLLAVAFPAPDKGWVVGHDGVILNSTDGGKTWNKQLDRRDLEKIVPDQGADSSFLDLWFADENNGFVVGAFNLILRTNDGGKSWQSWRDRTENPNRLHLYAIRGIGKELFIAGEQGLVMKLDAAAGSFKALATPYKGSYFGIAGIESRLVVFGLRGNAFSSEDAGRSWKKLETGLQEGITAATAVNRQVVLVSQAGRVMIAEGAGDLRQLKLDRTSPASAVVAIDPETIVLSGARGVRVQPLR